VFRCVRTSFITEAVPRNLSRVVLAVRERRTDTHGMMMARIGALVLALAVAFTQASQSEPAATLPAALARLHAQDAAGAAAIAERVVRTEPGMAAGL
jgi:hypothetical protein